MNRKVSFLEWMMFILKMDLLVMSLSIMKPRVILMIRSLICKIANNINSTHLKHFIEAEEIVQNMNFTVNNIKTESSFEKLNINDNVKIEDEITTSDDICIDFAITFLSCNR